MSYVQTNHEAIVGRNVVSLMSMEIAGWDEEVVNDIFTERDANLILSIPLQSYQEDSWYWRQEKMGSYSVKSAYAMIRARKDAQHSSDNSGFWRKLWNLKVPLKVKHLLWRAASGILPTKDVLIARRIEVCSLCPVCNMIDESAAHVLINCSFAKSCWEQVEFMKTDHNCSSFAEGFHSMIQNYNNDEMKVIGMVCWSLWKNRNNIVWNQKSSEAREVVKSGILVLNQWQSAQDRSFDNFLGFLTPSDGNEHWNPPQVNTVKVNTDAALFEESGRYSFSILARDHEGTMIEAKASCKQGSVAPEIAEAIGVREALSWIKSKDWLNVTIETDCLLVVQAIRSDYANLSYFGRIIDECKQYLSELRGRMVTLNFVKRSANVVAHFLARCTSSIADRRWTRDNLQPELLHVMLNDLKN